MTDTPIPPWEPPLAGTEVEHLLGALDRQRWTFRWKADGLDAEGLGFRLPSSSLTLGGLLKHLTACEAFKMSWDLDGSRPWEPFAREDAHDWAFASAASDSPESLYALYDATVARARARERAADVVASGGLDQSVALGEQWGETVSLRRILFDLLEEYARHTGHADLLREAIDGRVGEDPPGEWRPTA